MIVAEVAQAHDGSLGTAHAYIDAAAQAGADAIKFQTHIASAESTPGEPWRVKFSRQDATRYDYWRRMEFTEEQWFGLAAHAEERGLIFLSSAFSFEAVDLLERVGVPAWKVGAGETSNIPLLEKMAATGKPVILSSGMSGWEELDAAVNCVRSNGAPVGVLQCTTAYPCPPEKLGLNVIGELRQRYNCPVGLSDHSGTVYAGFAAATLGANIIEVHITLSRK
ncbi:MAG: N-acetylneuraminate synthase family protein, partial [Acidobacteria bacterium]|nr:N-acetylneuraminate synthase family protein [Acidobacteriota bacterium]